MIRCTCCQAEITAPQFFNGNPYGYTCIKKVSDQKRFKLEYKPCDSFKIIGDLSVSTRVEVVYEISGKKHRHAFYMDQETGTFNPFHAYVQDGILYLPFKK